MIKKLMFIWISLLFAATASHAQTTLQYIHNNVAYAQELMRENHVPASIILAVAIHESAAGTSKIAKYLNNHFGVKGKNSSKEIKSAYKGYSTVEDSYDHFIEVLQDRAAFSRLFNKYDEDDYMDWAKGIQRGGYAHSKLWSSKVIAVIKKYELFKYDKKPVEYLNAVLPVSRLK